MSYFIGHYKIEENGTRFCQEKQMFPSLVLVVVTLAQPPEGLRLVEPLITLPAHQPQAITVAFSADGNRFSVHAVPGSLTLLRANLLAIGDLLGGVTVWNLERGTLVQSYTGHQGAVLGIDEDPAGKLLATASHDGTVKLWPLDFATGRGK